MATKAYSYLRFSSAAQKDGDSLRRQLKAAMDWAAERPDVELDTSLRDLGVSAFKGEHRVKGALSSFLNRVKSGDIPVGSYFLVESFDRLSRESETVAINLLTSITLAGIKVVTLTDEAVYDEKSDAMDLMRAIIVMSRAHQENKARGIKLASVWAEKKQRARETGEVVSRRGPAWTIFNETTRRFDIIGDRADVVRRIYADCNDGLGITAIASRLNSDKVAPFVAKSDGWHQGYVLTILRSPSVCGYYQPTLTTSRPGQRMMRKPEGEAIADYYPRIISDETFDRAQAMIAMRNKRGGGKGRRGKAFPNLLIGIGRCEQCGGTLIMGSRANSGRVRHYRCYQASRAHRCDNRQTYLSTAVEEHLTHFLLEARMEEVRPSPHQTAITGKIAARATLQSKIDALVDQIESGSWNVSERLRQREIESVTLDREIDQLRKAVKASVRLQGREAMDEASRWMDGLSEATGDELYRNRAKANAMLNGLFDAVVPFENGEDEIGLYVVAGERGWRVTDELFTEIVVEAGQPLTRMSLDRAPVVSLTMI